MVGNFPLDFIKFNFHLTFTQQYISLFCNMIFTFHAIELTNMPKCTIHGILSGLLFIILICGFCSCFVKNNRHTTTVGHLFDVRGKWEVKAEQSKNGISGYCHHGGDTLFFSKKSVSDTRLESPALDYLSAFRNYHHTTFFDYIFLDKKLNSLYRDSITVDTVYKYERQKGLVYPCRGCNAVANIRFRQSSYRVPHTLDPDLMKRLDTFIFVQKTTAKGHLSTYYPKDGITGHVGCQFMYSSMDSVLQLDYHSLLPVKKKLNVLSDLIFHE